MYNIGHGLVLEHYRDTQCLDEVVLEEIQPIERNLFYDFNYQQVNTLPNERNILPVSAFIHTCTYCKIIMIMNG